MRTSRCSSHLVRVALAVAFVLMVPPLAAQDPSPGETGYCGRGRPSCRAFGVIEFQVGFDVLNDSERTAALAVGVMKSVADDWAVGGVAALNIYGLNWIGFKARGRRWLDQGFSIEGELGPISTRAPERGVHGLGGTVGARVKWRDFVAVYGQYDLAPVRLVPTESRGSGVCESPDAVRPHPRQSLILGGGLGSWAMPVGLLAVAHCASH